MRRTDLFLAITVAFLLISLKVSAKRNGTDSVSDVIHIYGNKYYPPCEFLDENGNPQGFCVDLIKEVMRRMHKRYTIKMTTREGLLAAAKTKKADLILEMTYTPERAKFLHYGTIYNYAFKGVVYRNEEEPVLSFKKLKNKIVAVERHSFAEKMIRSLQIPVKVIPVGDLKVASRLLNSRKCDAIVCNLEIARYIAEHNEDLSSSDLGLPPEKFCLSGENDTLVTKADFIIYDMKKDGSYDKLHAKWFSKDKSQKYLKVIYIGVTVSVIVCAIFIIFSILLRYKVKKAKQQLERNQRSLAMSLHAGNIGIWEFNIAEERFYNIFCDYFPDEGRSYEGELKLMHPDDVKLFRDAMTAAINGKHTEKPICMRKDDTHTNNWRYIEKELHPLHNEKGEVVKVIGTHKDVTVNMMREHKIEELLKDHEIMFSNTSVGTQYFDANGYLVNINDAACEIFGVTDKQALIDSRPNLFEYPQMKGLIDKNDLRKSHFIIHDNFDLYTNIQSFGLRKKHGEHYIETYITPVYDADKHLICIIVNNNDMTERETLRKQVEEYAFRMRYVLKSSGILTWKYDPDTHTRSSMDDNLIIPDNMKWKDMLQFVSEKDKHKFMDTFIAMDNREAGTFSTQIQFDKFYVDYRPACYTMEGTPFRNKEGKIEYYIGLSINITRLMDIQTQLEHEKEEAQKADRLKSAFLANVSHEIRTPLNSIVGFSDLLQYTDDEEEKKKFIGYIRQNNERLLKIIDDVLDLSKIESGTMAVKIEKVDIGELFSEMYEVFRRQLEGSKVELIYEQKESKCIMNTDRVRFNQVLTNFMTNAIKYTKEGHIRMGYGCHNKGLRIFVEDTGMGLPKDKKDLVFDRFEKLGSFVQGTGLGLSICKDIANMFGGKVGVDSELGKGSTFWMWVPCKGCKNMECEQAED